MTDEQLMSEYKLNDNPEAFQALYAKYSPIVYGYLFKKNFNKTNVDEIFQDIFFKFHQTRNLYDSKFPLNAWIFTIVRSCMYDYFRKIKSSETLNKSFKEFLLDSESQYNEADSIDLSDLNESEKDIIQKRYHEDWSFEEIAQQLEISEAGVRQRLSRALKSLRGKYARI